MPFDIHYPAQVKQVLNLVSPHEIWKNLEVLTKFPDRSADHQSGIQAAKWLQTYVQEMAKTYNRKDVCTYFIETKCKDSVTGEDKEYKQPSVITKIGASSAPGVVIGAHFDTVNCLDEGCKSYFCQWLAV